MEQTEKEKIKMDQEGDHHSLLDKTINSNRNKPNNSNNLNNKNNHNNQ